MAYTQALNQIPIIKNILKNYRTKIIPQAIEYDHILRKKQVSKEERRKIIHSFYSCIGILHGKAKDFERLIKSPSYHNLKGEDLVKRLDMDLTVFIIRLPEK